MSYIGNTVSNYAGILLLAIITLVGTPLLVNSLGNENFALFRIAMYTIVSYVTLLDLGIGIAVRRNLGTALHSGDELMAQRIVGAGFLFYLVLSGIIGVICIGLIFWLPPFLDIQQEVVAPFRCLIGCVFIYVFIYLLQSLPCAVFVVKSRYDLLQIPTVISSFILYFGAIAICPFFTQKLWGNCISSVIAQVVAFSCSIYMARKLWYGFGIKINLGDVELIKSMLSFGFYGVLIILVPVVLIQTQPIIMAKVLSFDSVAKYSIIIVLFTQLNAVIGASISSVFTSALEQKANGVAALKKLFIDSLGRSSFVWSLIAFPLAYYGGDFLVFWINSDYSNLSTPFRILIATSIFVPITITSNYILNAVGRIRPLAIISIFVLLLYILINVAIVYCTKPNLILFLEVIFVIYGIRGLFTGITACEQLNVSAGEFILYIVKLPIPYFFVFIAGRILERFFVPSNLFQIFVAMGFLSCVSCVFSFFLMLTKIDRKRITDRFIFILRKITYTTAS